MVRLKAFNQMIEKRLMADRPTAMKNVQSIALSRGGRVTVRAPSTLVCVFSDADQAIQFRAKVLNGVHSADISSHNLSGNTVTLTFM